MSNYLIKYGHVSGELSPNLRARTDLEKYDLGLGLAQNWFVDYRGGLFTRPGTIYRDWLQHPQSAIRWFAFEFSPSVANTNIVVFGQGYIRFLQEGNYVLSRTLTVTVFSPQGILTSAGHGLVTHDLVKVATAPDMPAFLLRTFSVVVLNANQFRLVDQFGADMPLSGEFSTMTLAVVYTLPSPYAPEDLEELNFTQIRDVARLTHWKYPTKDLKRLGPANWELTPTVFSAQTPRPIGLSGTASTSGSAGVAYCVTSVDNSGVESLPSDVLILTGIVNFPVTAGQIVLTWAPSANVAYYNVYRSTVSSDGTKTSRTQQLGFIGRAKGATFIDSNIIPNFTLLPPQQNNPFADGAIVNIDVSDGGSGYTQNSVMTITDPTGTGFIGYPVVSDAGTIVGAVILHGGENYTAPVVSVDVGSGAVFDAQTSAIAQNYPAVSTIFQQRQVYGGSLTVPHGIWGSRPRRFNNFDNSPIVVDNDAYSFELDESRVSMVRHLVPSRLGLIVMNDVGVWQLNGGDKVAITPSNAAADPQAYSGVSPLTPIRLESDILYVEAKGYTVRLLSYNDTSKVYGGLDISILSAHLFGAGKEIKSWAFAHSPYKLAHAIREDGIMLMGTIVKEQNVYAWTRASTRGFFRQVITLREGQHDQVYYDVERRIKGRKVRYIELQAQRDTVRVEDAVAVDCALSLPATYPEFTLTFSAATGDHVSVTASGNYFTADHVGRVIWAGGGKAEILYYTGPQVVTVKLLADIKELIPETELPREFGPGTWTCDPGATVLSGLWHLEGETVSILADGNVPPQQVVADGQVTLAFSPSKAAAGLPFTSIAKTLPPSAQGEVIEAKRKRIVGLATQMYESRGLLVGARLAQLYEAKERVNETWGEPIVSEPNFRYTLIEPEWNTEGEIYFVVRDPLPASILGHVIDIQVGDDTG